MKVEDLDAKIADGRLNEELTIYDPKQASRPDFWRTVFFSKTPRNLMLIEGKDIRPHFLIAATSRICLVYTILGERQDRICGILKRMTSERSGYGAI